MEERVDFLASLPIFEELSESELYGLAAACQAYDFEAGSVIAYQRDVAEGLYIVQNGRLFAHNVDERGHIKNTVSYLEGQYFGDLWLFATDAHPATVKAASDGRLLLLRGSDFLHFLSKHKQALAKLEPIFDEYDHLLAGLSEPAWEEANKISLKADKRSAAVSLLPDELVEYSSRRSRWFLFLRTLTPLLGLIIVPITVYFILVTQTTFSLLVTLSLTGFLAFIFLIWLGFQALDWSNDYFVITNKHLVHREFDLRSFRTNVIKVPIDQIQSVEIAKPNLLANVFDIGTARVTTAAQAGIIYFDNIDAPIEVKDTLDRLRRRVRALDAGREQAIMRRSIESHFEVPPAYHPVAGEEMKRETAVVKESPLANFWHRYRNRVEEKGVITYRKHFFVLLQSTALPIAFALVIFILYFALVRFALLGGTSRILIFLLLAAVDFGWLIWQVEDWRNDTFQITDRYVIDVDRRPFGFGESRKQAELSNVQNVNADRPGLLATLFNFGSVVIDTAGSTADIVFENVSNPSRVQSDVFIRRDQYQRKRRESEGERRRKEYAVLLDVYKQAEEQQRLPQRTYYQEVNNL